MLKVRQRKLILVKFGERAHVFRNRQSAFDFAFKLQVEHEVVRRKEKWTPIEDGTIEYHRKDIPLKNT